MTAKVDILTATSEDAVTAPIQAVVKRTLDEEGEEVKGSAAKGIEESDVVYVIEEGEATALAVETGISDELYVEIIDGLTDGQEVIIGPYRTLKNMHAGDAVKREEKKGDEGDGDDEEGGGGVEVRVD
jgi:HlyD family secretion protein